MHNMIIDAIHNQTCLEFYYDGGMRTVEPHCYGCGRNGELLRAYQVCGYSESGNVEGWKTFTIGKISAMSCTDDTFRVRDDFKHGDKDMINGIYAEV